jgi:hypothetical protein
MVDFLGSYPSVVLLGVVSSTIVLYICNTCFVVGQNNITDLKIIPSGDLFN